LSTEAVLRNEDRSLISLAVCSLLHQTSTDCVILGAPRLEQLQETLNAAQRGSSEPMPSLRITSTWVTVHGAAVQSLIHTL
jgi:hypothetical protein